MQSSHAARSASLSACNKYKDPDPETCDGGAFVLEVKKHPHEERRSFVIDMHHLYHRYPNGH